MEWVAGLADEILVPLLSRHPLSISIVLAALAACAGVFLFARPQYHPPQPEGSLFKVDMSRYPTASSGWRWSNGQPGFRFHMHEEEWNLSGVQAAELAPARAAA